MFITEKQADTCEKEKSSSTPVESEFIFYFSRIFLKTNDNFIHEEWISLSAKNNVITNLTEQK